MLRTLFRQLTVQRRRERMSVAQARAAHEQGREGTLLHGRDGGEYVGDFVFGGIDGAITTFAIVAGVAGAHLPPGVVIVLGLANLIADGFSMGIGNLMSIRSTQQRYRQEERRELWEMQHIPEHEQQEVRDIYAAKGFSGDTLNTIVETITADREQWLQTMMADELGLAEEPRSPWIGGLTTLVSFILIGSVPLISFAASFFVPALEDSAFWWSVVLTGLALFTIGALKSIVIPQPVWRAGLETFLVGGLAAGLAYAIGFLLQGIA